MIYTCPDLKQIISVKEVSVYHKYSLPTNTHLHVQKQAQMFGMQ